MPAKSHGTHLCDFRQGTETYNGTSLGLASFKRIILRSIPFLDVVQLKFERWH